MLCLYTVWTACGGSDNLCSCTAATVEFEWRELTGALTTYAHQYLNTAHAAKQYSKQYFSVPAMFSQSIFDYRFLTSLRNQLSVSEKFDFTTLRETRTRSQLQFVPFWFHEIFIHLHSVTCLSCDNYYYCYYYMELQPALFRFRSCSMCRTLRCVSLCRVPDDHHLSHSSSSCIGSWFDNGLITSWPSWHYTTSTTLPPQSTSAVTSILTLSLVGFALLLCHESANRLPEPTSPTVLFAAPLLLFRIH